MILYLLLGCTQKVLTCSVFVRYIEVNGGGNARGEGAG